MTQQEFEQLTGKTVTDEEFERINRFYMMDDSIDKQTFCEEFNAYGDKYLASIAEKKCAEQATKIAFQSSLLDKMAKLSVALHDQRASQALDDAVSGLQEEAEIVLGTSGYAAEMIRRGLPLDLHPRMRDHVLELLNRESR